MSNAPSPPRAMLGALIVGALADRWWLILLRGACAVLFGILAIAWPGITIVTLTFLFGAYAMIDGAVALWAAISGPGDKAPRWWLAIVGLAGIVTGIVAFAMPLVVAELLLLFIAIWAIAIGVLQVWGAVRLRKEIDNEWTLALTGALSVLFGVGVILQPAAGALAVVWVIACFAILLGALYIALALRLRKLRTA